MMAAPALVILFSVLCLGSAQEATTYVERRKARAMTEPHDYCGRPVL